MAWAPDYVTTSNLKELLRVSDTEDDTVFAWAITAASRAVDQYAGRQFGLVGTAEARYYAPRWNPRSRLWTVPCDDLMTDSGLSVAVDLDGDLSYEYTVTEVAMAPANAAAKGMPWTSLVIPGSSSVQPTDPLVDQVMITARWGWSSIPTAVIQATLLQASRLVARRDSPFGVAGSPDAGSEMRLLARVDPDVAVTLRPYRRVWGAM